MCELQSRSRRTTATSQRNCVVQKDVLMDVRQLHHTDIRAFGYIARIETWLQNQLIASNIGHANDHVQRTGLPDHSTLALVHFFHG